MDNENTPQSHNASFKRLRRELTIERVAFLAYITLTVAYMVLSQRADQPWAIYVDGRQVAVTPNRPTAAAILAEARKQESNNLSDAVRFKQQVEIRKAGWRTEPDGLIEALSAVEAVTTVEVRVPAIFVDGKPVIGAPDKITAEKILDEVKMRYVRKVESLYEEPYFKEKVSIGREWLSTPRVFRTAQDGADALTQPLGKPAVHKVEKGELAITIAKKYGISLETLQELNPGRKLERLQIGDYLRVGAGPTPLTVVVRAKRGNRVITYENGVEVKTDTI